MHTGPLPLSTRTPRRAATGAVLAVLALSLLTGGCATIRDFFEKDVYPPWGHDQWHRPGKPCCALPKLILEAPIHEDDVIEVTPSHGGVIL